MDFIRHSRTTPVPGAERRALKQQLIDISQQLVFLQEMLEQASPHLEHQFGILVGDVLARKLNQFGFYRPLGSGPVSRFSIRDLDLLELEYHRDTGEPIGTDRISAGRFVTHMEQEQYKGRTRHQPWEACKVLAALLRDLNEPLIEHLDLAGQSQGGRPGKQYRNIAIVRLAVWFEELYGERPTPTPSGRFVQFCELILAAIGLDTEGLDSAIARQLARDRG